MLRRAVHYLALLTLVINSTVLPAQAQPNPTQQTPAIVAGPEPQKAPVTAPLLAPDTAAPPLASSSAPPQRVALDVAQIPLAFVANSGQTDKAVRFQTRGMNGSIFFTPNEIAVTLPVNNERIASDTLRATDNPRASRVDRRTAALRLRYDGANPAPTLKSAEQLPGTTNYLFGNRPERWRTNLATYAGVVYQQLYPGIDLRYTGTDGQLKSTYTVAAGADPSRIRWHYQGAAKLQIDPKTGDLLMTLAAPPSRTGVVTPTTLIEQAPIAWQIIDGQRVPVEVAYTLRDAAGRATTAAQTPTTQLRVSFALGAYDASQPLIIDPTLTYRSYLGGASNQDLGWDIAADDAGNSYVVGTTWSTDFPTTTLPLQPSSGGSTDIFVAKLNADGDALVYSTYLGGSGEEEGTGIVVDGDGNAIITGYTKSAAFPTTVGVAQPTCAIYAYACQYSDAIVTKLNADGDGLVYSTFLGGNDIERAYGIALDGDDNTYITGLTWSPDFPTSGSAPQPSGGGNWDGFIAKLDDTASNLIYATYIHGSNYDQATAIAVDSDDSAYVTGYTNSTNVPTTTGALQETSGGSIDAFLIKLNAAGTAWDYSTYLGGVGDDYGYGVAVDGDGQAHVTGLAWSVNFPTTAHTAQPLWNQDPSHTNYNPDAFVTKVNSAGDGLIYSTYLGGWYDESGRSIAIDSQGRAVVAGYSGSYDFPTTTDAAQPSPPGNYNGFVAVLTEDGQALRHSTYIGGNGIDYAYGVGLDDDDNIVVTGETRSTDFSTSGVVQPIYGGNVDAFAAKIEALPVVTPTVFLSATITPTLGTANDQSLSLVVEARDANGALVTGYLGAIDLVPTAPTSGLPYSGGADYTFTALDAGRHVFNYWSFNWTGTHVVYVREHNPATVGTISNPVTVGPITLSAVISPTTVFATEPILSLVIEARDAGGNLAQGYRGSLDIDASSSISGLPQAMLNGAADYSFSALDAGRHVFNDWSFNIVGTQAITVTDRDVPTRQAVTNNVTVEQVYLTAAITPTAAFAGEPILALAIEARDSVGDLVPGYRGALDIDPSSTTTGLPQSMLSTPDYVFGAGDAGQHVFEDIAFYAAGTQAITVTDRGDPSRYAVSNTVNISDVHFVAIFDPDDAYYNDKVLTMTLEVLDDSDQLVCGYRGAVDMNPSVPMINLPQSAFNATADYVFTEEDCGRHVFPDLAFTTNGDQSVTVVDRGDPSRSSTSNGVTITTPPDPTPIPALPPPMTYTVPMIGIDPPPFELGWGKPFRAINTNVGLNGWEGYPKHAVPTKPGSFYILSGAVQRDPLSWWPTTLYACAYLGWEDQLTGTRLSGGFLYPHDDPTFSQGAAANCDGSSSYGNNGAVGFFRPILTLVPAPVGTKGVHVNIQGAGNTIGSIAFGANDGLGSRECDSQQESIKAGDPIDTRDGAFFLYEHDLGVATGCQDVALRFERAYDSAHMNATTLSVGWVHNYEQRIMVQGDYAIVQRPRGAYLIFKDIDEDVYASPAGDDHRLVKRSGGGWALLYRDQRADLFDADGRLIAQQDPNGNQIWLTYEPYSRDGISGTRLARVDAPGGRYLWMGYDYYLPNRLTVVGDNSGRRVRYGYDDLGRLETATDPLGSVATYAYSSTLWLMTSKTDELDNTIFTNTYDQDGQVIHHTMNLSHELNLAYAIITDTIEIEAHIGPIEAADQSALFVTTITDQTGAQAEYVYGDDGLLRTMTDPLGATTHYRGYTATRDATEIEDALGHITSLDYNGQGLPTVITDTLGASMRFAYDSWGKPTVITDTLGHAYTFSYDGPNLTEIAAPLGRTIALQYQDQAGWNRMLSTIIQQGSITTTLTYDTAGDLRAITDALDNTTQLDYDEMGRPITLTDARGYTTTLEYDSGDNLKKITDALSQTVRLEYDAIGNLIGVQDQVGATTLITYTNNNLPIALQDAQGGVIQIEYDTLGRPITLTDQLDQQYLIAYDRGGRVIAVSDPLGHTTQYGYDLLGNTTVITDANGHATTIIYDDLSRPVEVRNAADQYLRYGYDIAGNVVVITDTLGAAVNLTYDALSRPHTVVDQLGNTTTYTYTALGLLDALRDANGQETRYQYDLLGRLQSVVANAQTGVPASADVNVQTQFAYDPVGNLLSVTDPREYVTQFSYTALNQLASATDPLSRTMQYAYDPRGLLERWTKADGTPIDYTYNALGLPTEVNAPDQTVEYAYDALGRRTALDDATGTTSYTYNAASRPLTVTLSTGESIGYRYDDIGNRTQLIYPDGQTAVYTYTAANQLDQVADWDGGVTQYSYDSNGRPTVVTFPNGVTTTLQHNAAGQVLTMTHALASGPPTTFAYRYDPTGRRSHAIEDTRTISYTYDGLYRLVEARESTGDLYQYVYDAAGNRLSKIEPGEVITATYDSANQILALNGLPVSYDTNGNLLDDGQRSFAYDDMDQLIQVTQGITSTTFGYTGDGDRLWQATDGVTTTFTLDLNTALTQVLAQQGGGHTTHFLPGGGQQVDGVWQYLHADALGSVRLLSDASGQGLGTMRYSPFGEIEEQSGASSLFGFTGEPQDPASGLTYLRARYYDPALGRFLTPDAIVPDPINGQAWNAYAYVYNDPVNLVDPSGFAPGPCSFLPMPECGGGTQDVGSMLGDFGEKIGNNISKWWDKKSCTCLKPGLFSNLGNYLLGALGAGWLGIKTTPSQINADIVKSERTAGLFSKSSWTEVARPYSGTYEEMLEKMAGHKQVIMQEGRRLFGARTQTRWRIEPTGTAPKAGIGGLPGAVIGSFLVDAILQGINDGPKCLSPHERLHNMLVSGLVGILAGLAGAATFSLVAAAVVPMAGVTIGVGAAIVAGATVGYVADNFGPLATIRDERTYK